MRFSAQGDCRLILTGRRKERLIELAKQLEAPVYLFDFDIRDPEAVKHHIGLLNGPWRDIDILVNNAGLAAGKESIQEGELDDWEQMIDTNIKGLLYITREVAPLMIEQGQGHIINIGSISGREVYPGGGVYCATKYAVRALSRGMRMDLLQHGIRVSEVAPGLAHTEFSQVRFKGDQDLADQVYTGMRPLSGDDVARVVEFVAGLPPHMNLDTAVVLPTDQASAHLVRRG